MCETPVRRKQYYYYSLNFWTDWNPCKDRYATWMNTFLGHDVFKAAQNYVNLRLQALINDLTRLNVSYTDLVLPFLLLSLSARLSKNSSLKIMRLHFCKIDLFFVEKYTRECCLWVCIAVKRFFCLTSYFFFDLMRIIRSKKVSVKSLKTKCVFIPSIFHLRQ